MPITAALRHAYELTAYRVRLSGGGFAVIRCGAVLPPAMAELLRGAAEPWGFLTAWNPASKPAPRGSNRAAQRTLLVELRAVARLVRPGVGVGPDGWREPSLWAVGVPRARLDALARDFGQLGYLYGAGGGRAQLVLVG